MGLELTYFIPWNFGLTREQVVDRLAAGGGRSRKAYLEALVAVASGAERCPSPAPAFAGECHLAKRISLLLKEVPMSKSRLVLSLLIAAAAAAAGSAGVAAAAYFPLDVAEKPAKKSQPAGNRVYRIGDGVVAPKLLSKVEPKYSEEAREAKVQGTVKLAAVIESKGRAEDIQVLESLEPSLDKNAVEAVRQWVFQPGTKAGKPVRVRATIEVNFKLK